MDNFKIIYRVLRILERAMDLEEFDSAQISAKLLNISESRWCSLIEMLVDTGYIKGIKVSRSIDGQIIINQSNIRITLKGLEYLDENSFMKRAANIEKGVSDLIP